MIPYLLAFFMILYGVFEYDIRGRHEAEAIWYWGIMLYLAILSGFAYRLGGDGMEYMNEYSSYALNGGLGLGSFSKYPGRMPGWVLLSIVCKMLCNDYSFFKIVHALLLNILFFRGMRHLTKWRFSCVLFYFVLIYFDYNFQLLRQSLAVGFFLNAIPFFERRSWGRYYLICLIGLCFHESIAVAFLLPFVRNIKINEKTLFVFSFVILIIIGFSSFFTSRIVEIAAAITHLSPKISYYSSQIEIGLSFSFFLNIMLNVVIPTLFVSIFLKEGYSSSLFPFVLSYSLLYTIGLYIPIIYRINQYFLLCFYAFFIEIFAYVAKRVLTFRLGHIRFRPGYAFVIICLCFLLFKARVYRLPYGDTNYPVYVQYYPYRSIIFKKTDPLREAFFLICN